jgi:ABC-2 type transport system ATP-binding protein
MTANATHQPPDPDGGGMTDRVESADETDRAETSARSETAEALAVSNLQKVYGSGDDAVTAVDGVSFTVNRGEVVGILGPNGAGKTTTIKSILGLVEPSGGTITVDGVDPAEAGTDIYQHVSAVLEGARNVYWRLTVRENLRYFTGIQGIHPDSAHEEYDRLLELVDLEAKADEPVRNLSRGMQQKASLACALARDTPVVFLDEPTLGLDVEAARDLRQEIRRLAEEENRTIILSSHDMDVIQDICDRVVILNEGRVVADDTVDSLVDLFATQTYQLDLADRPDALALDAFEATWVSEESFEVVLTDSDELYDLMRTLEASGAAVQQVTSLEPEFEDIFLSVIDDETEETGGESR